MMGDWLCRKLNQYQFLSILIQSITTVRFRFFRRIYSAEFDVNG